MYFGTLYGILRFSIIGSVRNDNALSIFSSLLFWLANYSKQGIKKTIYKCLILSLIHWIYIIAISPIFFDCMVALFKNY